MIATATHTVSREFVLAGKAVFTVENAKGDYYTYRVKKAKDSEVWFASLLIGPDNEHSYTYLGLVDAGLRLRLTAKSKMLPTSVPVRVLEWALRKIATGSELPDGYAIHHVGRCGRTLTVPESIESGIGPECAKHL